MLNPLNDWNNIYHQLRIMPDWQKILLLEISNKYRNNITLEASTPKLSYFQLVPLNKVKVIQGYAGDEKQLFDIIKDMKNGKFNLYQKEKLNNHQLIGVLGYANERLIFNYTNIFNLKSNVKTDYENYSMSNIRLFFYFMPKVEMDEEKIKEFKETLLAYFDIYTNNNYKEEKNKKQKLNNRIIVNVKRNNFIIDTSNSQIDELAFSSVIIKEGLFFPYYNLFSYRFVKNRSLGGINITNNMTNLNINPVHHYICAGGEDPLSKMGKIALLMCNADSAYTQSTCQKEFFFEYIEANVQLAIELMEEEYGANKN